ncbi:MAG TPA: hypothetical protein VE690_00740 [Rhodopila sp.]|jgi:hypothetical protein|nr:hypothetical protein [Rhodopila sp.]
MLSSRTIIVAGLLVMLAGCADPTRYAARHLQQRLQTNLSPQIASRQVTVDNAADGARVILPEPALFVPRGADLTVDGAYLVASVTESLLDPHLMQVNVTDTSGVPDNLRTARMRSVRNYVEASELGPSLPIGAAAQSRVNVPPEAMVVDIRVHCPPGPQGTTWGYARQTATCN